MTRRAFFATVAGVTSFHVPVTATRAGVHMTGKFDATQTERSERYLNFGKTFALVVNGQLWLSQTT